jgi:Ca2+-transporting ATPase
MHIHPESQGLFNTTAATMAFATLSFSELLRAYTARSERYSLFKIGMFRNRAMNWAVLASALLLLAAIYIPQLQVIFETVPLGWIHWKWVLPLLFVPSVAAEITKWFISKQEG